ncbi:lactate utilization protein C [Paenibacillus sp. J31TS4]|uniref:LutC/YkgG family protein n=1 Tax=Paenibacillus sp. J31TS4 TaxID=2807195 RepID=UPI001B2E8D58|nr:LUD domain-containing protein [Paenibacillus sp. J31TS4]GIP39471.1 lactate utilization protein C [Paenibacillus sp. J31TS4]
MTEAVTHAEWLAQKERESRVKQEAFLKGISSRLGRQRSMTPPPHPFKGAPDFWNVMDYDVEHRMTAFVDQFSAAGGHAVRFPDMEAAAVFIAERAIQLKARRLVRQDQPELAALDLEKRLAEHASVTAWNTDSGTAWKTAAAEADIGIVLADYAVAHTGSVVALSAAHKGRSVSLLPAALFVLLPAQRIRTRLGEVLAEFDRSGRAGLPAGIHFISGPSRSSDIENDLTIGVHGPGLVYALLVDAFVPADRMREGGGR